MTGLRRPSGQAVTPRMAFLELRRSLTARRIRYIQFVYCVLADIPHVTLCAGPMIPGTVVKIPKRLRQRLVCIFCDWMAWHESDWLAGPDCAGVLAWELSVDQFTHRHSGYTQQYFSRTHADDDNGVVRFPRTA
jgi:hypothetical protein